MKKVEHLIENQILKFTKGNNAYSICKLKGNVYDIYLSTKSIKEYYFFTLHDDVLYDIFKNPININDIGSLIYQTEKLISLKYNKILEYESFSIHETTELDQSAYKKPEGLCSNDIDVDRLHNNAYMFFEKKNFEESINKINIALLCEPWNSDLYRLRALCYNETGNWNEGIKDICRSGICNPISNQNLYTFTYELLANFFKLKKDFVNSIRIYSLIINDYMDSKDLLQNRALCYIENGEHENALSDLFRILNEINKTTDNIIASANKCTFGKHEAIDVLFKISEVYLIMNNYQKAKYFLNEVINFSWETHDDWIGVERVLNKIKDKKGHALTLLKKIS